MLWRSYNEATLYASPVVENNVVYTTKGAVSAITGKQIWTINGYKCCAVEDGYYYTNYNDPSDDTCHFAALDVNTGKILWQKKLNGQASSPAIADGKLFITDLYSPSVLALDAYTGDTIWESETTVEVYLPPVVWGDFVYVSGLGESFLYGTRSVYCIEASSGRTVWNQTVEGFPTAPAVAYGCVYVGTGEGYMYAFDALTGAKKWVCGVVCSDGGIEFSPVVASGAIFFGASDGHLYALNATSGVELWRYEIGRLGSLYASLAIANGCIYIGSCSSKLMALGFSSEEGVSSVAGSPVDVPSKAELAGLFLSAGTILIGLGSFGSSKTG
ncbi:MAG: PQQ-binding-like beta-propeller repeat protein [Candidatus Bathyarchaeota archaeon]|nr:PQQ-binding-like beta-propeller repeat protein [Candidatus Termitimicrobium sp.]MCL2684859.1 PQQ-binding-like beta-propeller repeat protein [Candidatus Termitimicrobium sp.]